MMMQASTTMVKILIFGNYSVFDEPHFLKISEETFEFSF